MIDGDMPEWRLDPHLDRACYRGFSTTRGAIQQDDLALRRRLAVRHRDQIALISLRHRQVSVAISLVVVWAVAMIFALPLVCRSLGLSTGVAGAWIGTSEFADAAGLAAAQAYGGYAGHVPQITGSVAEARA